MTINNLLLFFYSYQLIEILKSKLKKETYKGNVVTYNGGAGCPISPTQSGRVKAACCRILMRTPRRIVELVAAPVLERASS